jgi:hypothetical protein
METTNPVKGIAIGLVLLIISFILKTAAMLISWIANPIYYIATFKWKTGGNKLAEWLYTSALANDQTGNAQSAIVFQFMFTKKGSFKFGDPDDTVSYVLARNKYKGKLNLAGRIIGGFLDAIDHDNGGHLKKSIESKIESDQEALVRMQENKYFK